MNIAKMMKDLQRMQTDLQDKVEALELEGSAGGGAVTVRMNGKKELLAVHLAPEAVTPDDRELMEDLIVAAVNDASRKVEAEVQRLTQGLAGALKIPGLG